jgi:pimeloyl-ACP methyl ester carboxylesterase
MLQSVWRCVAVALVCAGMCAATPAAEPASTEPCVERVAEGASAPAPRLARLQYRCLALQKGQRVLVGEAGLKHPRTVLLVHGLGNNAHRDWGAVVSALAVDFHVVALDLPGFGASPGAPEGYSFPALGRVLAEVVEQTAPGQRVHVVGHSLGGAVSLYFAHAHADKVDRLVLVDAAGILLKMVFAQHIASLRMRQVGIAPVDNLLKGLSERLNSVRRLVFNDLDNRFDFSRWLAQNPGVRNTLLGRYTQVEAGLGLVEHDFTAAIRETAAPTTVIWGRDDPIAPLRTGLLLAERMPDARLKVIDGVGHTPMLESPEAFKRLLQEALSAPPSPKPAPAAPEASQGHVVCQNKADQRYSGSFDSLTLENCSDARIEGAQLKQLTLKSSSVTLDNSVIESSDVALVALRSEVTATGVRLRGRVAISADDSRLDLAGASLYASERNVEMPTPSRLYFSVSDLHGSDYSGDAHLVWHTRPASP